MNSRDVDTADIDAQIALLQAEKARKVATAAKALETQRAEEAKVLVGSTPVKSKIYKTAEIKIPSKPAQPVFSSVSASTSRPPKPRQILPEIPLRPPPSNMSDTLAALRQSSSGSSSTPAASVPRSTTFADRPVSNLTVSVNASTRAGEGEESIDDRKGAEDTLERKRDDEYLTIIENLVLGPKKVGKDPEGEDEWRNVEPNSGIRLSKRVLSHAALQDHIFGRYHISPSQLYSVIRLSRDGATYEVPVEGDWLTIAVVAERSDIRISGAKEQHTVSDIDDSSDEDSTSLPSNRKTVKPTKERKTGDKPEDPNAWKKRRGPRKYINLKLCSLPPRTRGSSSNGDALLQLLLFEADHIVKKDLQAGEDEEDEVTKRSRRSYRGGSGGAYEKWCNLAVGSVIAILNPRVLRPLRAGIQAPHPLTLPLALNPTSDECITLIGMSRDLGCCTAVQKDGNRCQNWVDIRQSPVCEYHVFAAVKRARAGRSEFTASTSAFALTTNGGAPTVRNPSGSFPGAFPTSGKGGYDPRRKTGLLPASGAQAAPRKIDNGGGGATYIVGGGVVRTSSDTSIIKGFGDPTLTKRGSGNGSEKRKRKAEEKELEEGLKKLLERDGRGGSTGARYLMDIERNKERLAAEAKAKGKKGDEGKTVKGSIGDRVLTGEERKRPFSAGVIRRIGFDPTNRGNVINPDDVAKRLDAISSLKNHADKPIKLGRPPGPKARNVAAPGEISRKKVRYDGDTEGHEGSAEAIIDLDDF